MANRLPHGTRCLAALLPALLLGACSFTEKAPPPACPDPAIVDGMDSNETLEPGRSGPEAVAWRTAMLGFGGGCAYEDGGVRLRYTIDLAVAPGPAFGAQDRPVPVQYFVAVADPAGEIIDKQVFSTSVPVQPFGAPVVATEQIEQKIAGVMPGEGAAWRIYLGLELPREEALRRRAGRP
ncbi:hypothetical protein SH611_21045 [Geminicoccaceae bacterium 1502E]|nr:hypothetical protein [Geminicoccaceae bacterium 1502E]